MSTLLSYKTYTAKVEFDPEAQVFHGRVLDINATVTFEVENAKEVKREFEKSVDEYLSFCKQLGQLPDRPFKGNIAFRTNPETHREICLAAAQADLSINSWMDRVLADAARRELRSKLMFSDPESKIEEGSLVELLNHKPDAVSTLLTAVKPFFERRGPETDIQILDALEKYIESRGNYLEATNALKQLLRKGEEESLPDLLIEIEAVLKVLDVPDKVIVNLSHKNIIGTLLSRWA